jgi:formylglycine-generating enzyme required for sulfatase activity
VYTKLRSILAREQLEHLFAVFADQSITDSILGELTEDDLKEWGVDKLGDRKRLLVAFRAVESDELPHVSASKPAPKAAMPANFCRVEGGKLPASSQLGAVDVSTFYIGKYPVRWSEFVEVRSWASAHGYDIGQAGAGVGYNYPVTEVNWYEALKWCNARSEMESKTPVYKKANRDVYRTGEEIPVVNVSAKGYRLPSEKEWEWAARGGTKTHGYTYSGSEDINEVAWYQDNANNETHVVGTKAANELGIHDMSGNVSEWCFDDYDGLGWFRVFRGGSWILFAEYCEVGCRDYWSFEEGPSALVPYIGFRLALSSVP